MHAHVCVFTHMPAHARAHAGARTHTHTHTHTHTRVGGVGGEGVPSRLCALSAEPDTGLRTLRS